MDGIKFERRTINVKLKKSRKDVRRNCDNEKSIRILAIVIAVILFFYGLANNINVFDASVSSDTKKHCQVI